MISQLKTIQFLLTTVVCELFMSCLQHKLCGLNQAYNIFTTVAHNMKNVDNMKPVLKPDDSHSHNQNVIDKSFAIFP